MKLQLDKPQIDYLTVTSFNRKLYELTRKALMPQMVKHFGWQEKLSETRLLQYIGYEARDHLAKQKAFSGEGKQKDKPHFLFRTSAQAADFAFRQLLSLELQYNTTRLDVQLTALPEVLAEASLWKDFNERQFKHEQAKGAKARKVVLVTNNTTGNTLYVGSRASARFIRVYQKSVEEQDSGQKKEPVRLEIELKGNRARAFHHQAKEDGLDLAMVAVLRDALEGLVETPLLEPHRMLLQNYGEVELCREPASITTTEATLIWFEQACIAAALRALLGEDTNAEISRLVVQLNRAALPNLNSQAKKEIRELFEQDSGT